MKTRTAAKKATPVKRGRGRPPVANSSRNGAERVTAFVTPDERFIIDRVRERAGLTYGALLARLCARAELLYQEGADWDCLTADVTTRERT